MKQTMITVIADFYLKEAQLDEALPILKNLEQQTQQEDGCLYYVLHKDQNDPTHFLLIEHWQSQKSLDAHHSIPHKVEAIEAIQPLLAKPIEVERFIKVEE